MSNCNTVTAGNCPANDGELPGPGDEQGRGQPDRPANTSRRTVLSAALGMALLAAGCGGNDPNGPVDDRAPEGWPRRVQGDRGAVSIARPPTRIVSTSVTLTGTLLTIGAPVIASAATQPGTGVSDGQGFFRQWSDIARKKGVTAIYTGEPKVEAIAAMAPDLILVAGTGGDSALRVIDQLEQIAPVLVLDYGNKSWQELAKVLAEATGREGTAREVIAAYDLSAAAVAAKLRLPPQPTTAMVYYEDGSGANIWTPASAQGKLLTDLGFTLAQVPPNVRTTQAMGRRNDVLQVSGEQFADALTGETILLFAADDAAVRAVRANRFLAHVPAVRGGRVHAMGRETFRLDYYSGLALLDRIGQVFA